MRHALGVILLFAVGSVQAAPVVWEINNAVFDIANPIRLDFRRMRGCAREIKK
jgi:hypothetical protein